VANHHLEPGRGQGGVPRNEASSLTAIGRKVSCCQRCTAPTAACPSPHSSAVTRSRECRGNEASSLTLLPAKHPTDGWHAEADVRARSAWDPSGAKQARHTLSPFRRHECRAPPPREDWRPTPRAAPSASTSNLPIRSQVASTPASGVELQIVRGSPRRAALLQRGRRASLTNRYARHHLVAAKR
jgi:hypothetical protein